MFAIASAKQPMLCEATKEASILPILVLGGVTDVDRAFWTAPIDTWRSAAMPGCGGTGDIRGVLSNGKFGCKCADINGLVVGLARAAGLPARNVYGIR